jgi:hypothetical protein
MRARSRNDLLGRSTRRAANPGPRRSSHEVDRLAAEDGECVVTRRRSEDVTILAEDGAERFSDSELVVDDQHAWPLDHGDA